MEGRGETLTANLWPMLTVNIHVSIVLVSLRMEANLEMFPAK